MKGRKPVPRNLPSLPEIFATTAPIGKHEHRLDRLDGLLLSAAQKLQRTQARPFYPMRDVAAYFEVSLSTVAKAYRQLDSEGWLTRIRSSQTVIPARSLRSKALIRGVVCIPIWQPGYLQFLDNREMLDALEVELSSHHLAPVPVFYRQSEELTPAFVNRVLKHNPSHVLWHCPIPGYTSLLLSLRDHSLQLVGLLDQPMSFPGTVFRMNWEAALQRGLNHWVKHRGIREIIVPRGRMSTTQSHCLERISQTIGMPFTFKQPHDGDNFGKLLEELAAKAHCGVLFDDDLFYSWLCLEVPAAMLRLIAARPVMTMRKVTITCSKLPMVTLDHLSIDWKAATRLIANHIAQGRQNQLPPKDIVFKAEWHPACPISLAVQSGPHA